jgi:hypothetical protein
MAKDKYDNKNTRQTEEDNSNWQGVDKAPGEEQGKKEKVTRDDLKGKKIDGDPSKESDKPLR